MSSLFQANLRGTEVGRDSPVELALGSKITLKNMGYGGGLLHSHVQTYPEGSQQQQITCYHHKDANNEWFIYTNRNEPDYKEENPVQFISDRSVIRLIHAQTGRNLHSHAVSAPVTTADNEVSCYGNLTVGDTKDHWQVEVVEDAASRDWSRVRTLTTGFRLRHVDLGCYLRAGTVNLPQWGFKQIETTCVKKNHPSDKYTHWNVEAHINDKRESFLPLRRHALTSSLVPPGNPRNYKSPFLKDFVHLNVAMMTSNNALVPDPDKQDDLASSPWQWPILNVGLRMCSWDDKSKHDLPFPLSSEFICLTIPVVVKYFLLGNPLVYWAGFASLFVFFGALSFYLVRWQRGFTDLTTREIDQFHYAGIYPVIGWFLHYLPFVAMARVTYVHHYYPALYYAIFTFGFCIDWITRNWRKDIQWGFYLPWYLGTIGLYYLFRAISFGMEGPHTQWSHLKWFESWRMTE